MSKKVYRLGPCDEVAWQDLNLRPSGYVPNELPNCSILNHLITLFYMVLCKLLYLG